MTNFSNWIASDTAPDHDGPAVYQYRLVVGGKPVPLGRFSGTDEGGWVVIGCINNTARRWRQSRWAWLRGYGSSTMNWGYYLERFSAFRRRFPDAVLEYHTGADRRRIDALLTGHDLFAASLHEPGCGVIKYVRSDLARRG